MLFIWSPTTFPNGKSTSHTEFKIFVWYSRGLQEHNIFTSSETKLIMHGTKKQGVDTEYYKECSTNIRRPSDIIIKFINLKMYYFT